MKTTFSLTASHLRNLTVAAVVLIWQQSMSGGGFEDKIIASGLVFTQPEGYQVVASRPNRDVQYDYALRHPTEKYEIRYSVEPISKQDVEAFKKSSGTKEKGAAVVTDPNQMFEAKFHAIALNIAAKADNIGPVQHFQPAAAKAEFGADDGMIVPMLIGSSFGDGFKLCMLVAIHKTDVADAFIFHLFDDPNEMKKQSQYTAFYALKFAPEKK
jgi:hypothetical protein